MRHPLDLMSCVDGYERERAPFLELLISYCLLHKVNINLDISGLRKLNSRLYVVRGQPFEALPNLIKRWNINYLSFNEDPQPYSKVLDHNIKNMCKGMGVQVVTEKSHTLYDLDSIIEKNMGKTPFTYKHFIR